MATTTAPQIAVICKVVTNTTRTASNGSFNSLRVLTGNGDHWDHVQSRKGMDKASLKVLANAKPGDTLRLDNCFIQPFEYNGHACAKILAGKATKA